MAKRRKLRQKPERWAVELDWASESDPSGEVYAVEHDLCSRVVQKHGPGGGWPVIEFSGTKKKIFALARKHLQLLPDEDVEKWVRRTYPPSIPLL